MFDSRPRRMVSAITLGTGLLASIDGVLVVAAMLNFAVPSYRDERHSPPTG